MALGPLHNPAQGKLRVVGFISGSGKTLWQALELQKQLEQTWEGSPFEVVGVFSSDPEAKGVATAAEYGIPCASTDIRAYYKERGAKLKDREVRREYDREAAALISEFRPGLVMLAGYVWATTEVLLNKYMFINVHPADLTNQKNGERLYAGPNGVGDALSAQEPFLRSSSHIATAELDGGPLLMISPKIPVDYEKAKEYDEKDFMKYYLRQVNAQSREVGSRTIYEIAMGNFSRDNSGRVYYRNQAAAQGISIDSWEKNKPLYARDTAALLQPKSVAVIGASSRGGIGHAIVKNIEAVDFGGRAVAVNRGGETVSQTPGYTSILDVPDEVDLAVITVPSKFVLQVADECGQKGVKAIVCISAGFREVGGEGVAAEEELLRIVNNYNMRLLGPNCMGVSNNNPAVRLNTTILHDIPRDGNIAFVTQSGGLGAVLLDYAEQLGIGFSTIASLGNQADVTVNDLLPLLAEDEQTEVIMLYLEQIADYQRFTRMAAKITPKKPIILLKAGRSSAGAAAAGSHTGSLAGDDQVAEALIRKCGIIRAQSIHQAYFLASALSHMPRMKGNRVGVVTNGGGPGILASDALSLHGFELPELDSKDQEKLAPQLLPEASVRNPIDVVASASPEHYAASLRNMVESGQYDAMVLLCIPPATVDTGEVARVFAQEVDALGKALDSIPVLSCFFGPGLGLAGRRAMSNAGLPVVEYPEQLAEVLDAMRELPVTYHGEEEPAFAVAGETQAQVKAVIQAAAPGDFMNAEDAEKILAAYGLNTAPSVYLPAGDSGAPGTAQTAQTATASTASVASVADLGAALSADSASEIVFPVVAKIDHPQVIHKSDEGGVVLNIADTAELQTRIAELYSRFPGARGVLVQQQLSSATEVILGAIKDPSVGHAEMVGMGGTSVELLGDVAFAHVPFSAEEARRAILSLKSAPLLTGYRGSTPMNLDDLIEKMLRINRLLVDFPEISEIDLNPLLYSFQTSRFYIADFRVRIEE